MNRLLFLLVLATTGISSSLPGQVPASALRRQVFVAESSFAASMAQRDLQAFASFVSSEAVFFGDTAIMRGKRAVIDGWRPFFEKPAAPFSWKPDAIEVLPSGNLAYSSGPVFDPGGKKVGSFSSVWRREPDGSWQIIFDRGCP
jgi:ketosteroid isomerase-like protein